MPESLDALFAPDFINFLCYRIHVRHMRELTAPSFLGTYHNVSHTRTLQQSLLTSFWDKHSRLLPWSLSSPVCTRRHGVLKSLIQLRFTSARGWSHLAEQEVCDSTRKRDLHQVPTKCFPLPEEPMNPADRPIWHRNGSTSVRQAHKDDKTKRREIWVGDK